MSEQKPPPIERDLCRKGRRGRQRAVLLALATGGLMIVAALTFAAGWWTTP